MPGFVTFLGFRVLGLNRPRLPNFFQAILLVVAQEEFC